MCKPRICDPISNPNGSLCRAVLLKLLRVIQYSVGDFPEYGFPTNRLWIHEAT